MAACALVSIRLDHADAAKIAKAAGLSAAEKDDLDEYCRMKVESTLFNFENESDFELLDGVLKQNQPRESSELRFALRQLEHAGPMAAAYQDDIRQHLRSPDVLTRKLAQRALKSIQGTTDH